MNPRAKTEAYGVGVDDLVRQIKKLLPRKLSKNLPQNIAVVPVAVKASRTLNLVYRDKNKAANVLSFYYGAPYGEILVCPEVIRKEAKAAGNSYTYQLAWMILHGMLHLAGRHHERSRMVAKKVSKLEQDILARSSCSLKSEILISKS